jgi:O-acetyl-ADP-ribose deacetylase (regulator of RNase III)
VGDSVADTTAGTSVRFGRALLIAALGDPLDQPVDALVLAANQRGVMGAGLAGAVRAAAGPEVEREAMERAPLPLGGALVTTSGKLGERGITAILHAVVSERLAAPSSTDVVRRATAALLRLADERRLRSVAIPPIGGGKGPNQLPVALAVEAIVDETIAHLRRGQTRLERVVFVSRHDDDVLAFAEAVARGRERSWRQSP